MVLKKEGDPFTKLTPPLDPLPEAWDTCHSQSVISESISGKFDIIRYDMILSFFFLNLHLGFLADLRLELLGWAYSQC